MIARILGLTMLAVLAPPAFSAETKLPTPAITIYPGDIVADEMLTETTVPYAIPAGAALLERLRIVGKVSRRTLLPGKPIPVGALDEPKIISNGASVRIVFDEPGLSIATFGQAMESGGAGSVIRVRNSESGVTVMGTIQSDGSVKVGG